VNTSLWVSFVTWNTLLPTFLLWKCVTDAGLILTLFVVGSSGAGKSTILGILLRLYEGVTAGTVTFDGKDIYQVDKQWLRSQMAIVTQEQVLFSGTIKDNIALGNERASMEDIEGAAVVRELEPDPARNHY
jgi:ABC-type multidrug transport system fused ATPase/permease subunit